MCKMRLLSLYFPVLVGIQDDNVMILVDAIFATFSLLQTDVDFFFLSFLSFPINLPEY